MYITYKITNDITGDFYYGSHKTEKIDDGYMGSGRRIKQSIKEYGLHNHTKEIIQIFNNRKDSVELEHDLIKRHKNDAGMLNESAGGQSWDYINENLTLNKSLYGSMASHDYVAKLHKEFVAKYNMSPNRCLCCGCVIEYTKRMNKFCSKSCAATYNNTHKNRKKYPPVYCKWCNALINADGSLVRRSFCSNQCIVAYKRKTHKPTELQRRLKEDYQKIVDLHDSLTYREIAKLYGTSTNTIKDLLKHKF